MSYGGMPMEEPPPSEPGHPYDPTRGSLRPAAFLFLFAFWGAVLVAWLDLDGLAFWLSWAFVFALGFATAVRAAQGLAR